MLRFRLRVGVSLFIDHLQAPPEPAARLLRLQNSYELYVKNTDTPIIEDCRRRHLLVRRKNNADPGTTELETKNHATTGDSVAIFLSSSAPTLPYTRLCVLVSFVSVSRGKCVSRVSHRLYPSQFLRIFDDYAGLFAPERASSSSPVEHCRTLLVLHKRWC